MQLNIPHLWIWKSFSISFVTAPCRKSSVNLLLNLRLKSTLQLFPVSLSEKKKVTSKGSRSQGPHHSHLWRLELETPASCRCTVPKIPLLCVPCLPLEPLFLQGALSDKQEEGFIYLTKGESSFVPNKLRKLDCCNSVAAIGVYIALPVCSSSGRATSRALYEGSISVAILQMGN